MSEPSCDLERDVVERAEVAEPLGHAVDRDHAWSFRGLSSVMASSVAMAMSAEQGRGGVGPGEVEVLEALLDEQRERLGLAGDAARDDAHRAELADRARRGQHDAVGDAPADGRQRDAPEGLPRARRPASPPPAPARRRPRAAPARPRARRTAARRRSWPAPSPGSEKMTWKGSETQPPRAVDEQQRQADDDRREREGQADERVDEAPCRGSARARARARRSRRRSCSAARR